MKEMLNLQKLWDRLRYLPQKFREWVATPWGSIIFMAMVILAVFGGWRFRYHQSQDRTVWIALLAFLFSLLSWFVAVAKQWPYMLIQGLPDEKNCFMIQSQQGACGVIAAFRFVNKSGNTNTVLKGCYQLRVGENQIWHLVKNPTLNELKNWLNDLEKQTPGIILSPPEVYPPYTARVRYVAFQGNIPWNREGNEKPPIWLKAEFEMADGESQTSIVKLEWSGNWPLQLPTYRL